MIKMLIVQTFLILVQYVCTAQGLSISNSIIDKEFKVKGDVVISFTRIGTVYDTLLFRRGAVIFQDKKKNIQFLSNSLRTNSNFPSTTLFRINKQDSLDVTHLRNNRKSEASKNNIILEFTDRYLVHLFISQESKQVYNQVGNLVRIEGWDTSFPQNKIPLSFITLQQIPNVKVLSQYIFLDRNIDSFRFKCVSIGNIITDTNVIPYFTDYVVSPNNFVKTRRSVELPPQTSRAFEPIAHSFQDLHQNHILLFGNIKDSTIDRNGYDIVVVDTTLSEVKRVSTDSTQMMFSNGIIYPTNLFTVNDKIFVTGFIDFGNETKPFFTEHTLEGEFVQTKIVNTNATIHSGSVSPDGKTVLMCGSVMNTNDNKDFFVVAINTETGSSTQKTWGDNRVNELFDILAISNDTAYVTGSEDKDFYAGRLINLQTMSVSETNDFEKNIQVTPNPASNTISISVQKLHPIQSKLTIQNMQGTTVAIVFEGIPNQTEVKNISIAHLPIGSYFITMENGSSTYRTLFVVKR